MTGTADVEGKPSWRADDLERFDATILAAAEQLGVQPLAVEKDYWVCEALRALLTAFPGKLVFKGGTSLEKLRLIQRFSEDLDLLLVDVASESNAGVERLLKKMCACAGTALGGSAEKVHSGGKPGSFHRSAYVEAPLTQSVLVDSALADPRRVLVELGQSGGDDPVVNHTVSSLLSRQLADAGSFEVVAWCDLAPFDARILHPGRTLIEKLLRVNSFAASDAAREDVHGWQRIGRQFYDIFALLGDDMALGLLEDKPQVRRVLDSCATVSEAFGGGDAPIPTGGFAHSPVFDDQGQFATRLREEHERAMRDLYYGLEPGPTFDAVLVRVHECVELLDPEA